MNLRTVKILLIRLADELEDHLDQGVLYCSTAEHRREYIQPSLFLSVGMAHKLGHPALASALARAFQETLSVELPAKIRRAQGHSFLLAQA